MSKTSSIRLVVSIQYRLVMDRRTDRRSHKHSIYRAIIVSRGKKNPDITKVARHSKITLNDNVHTILTSPTAEPM